MDGRLSCLASGQMKPQRLPSFHRFSQSIYRLQKKLQPEMEIWNRKSKVTSTRVVKIYSSTRGSPTNQTSLQWSSVTAIAAIVTCVVNHRVLLRIPPVDYSQLSWSRCCYIRCWIIEIACCSVLVCSVVKRPSQVRLKCVDFVCVQGPTSPKK